MTMRKSERRKLVAAYVAERLRRECETRGRAAEIAKRTGFTRGHISAIVSGASGVGEDFADQIAKVWGMSEEELEREATVWGEASGAVPPPSGRAPTRRLRDREDWKRSLPAAKELHSEIPERIWVAAGDFHDDVPREIDVAFVAGFGALLNRLEERDAKKSPESVVTNTDRAHVKRGKRSLN